MDNVHATSRLLLPDEAMAPGPALAGAGFAATRPGERLAFLDVAKGIGILLVVAGHCLGGLHDAGLVKETSAAWLAFYVIYCFHMPLFFFLSACLVEGRVTAKPVRFLKSNFTRIGYPYFLWGSVQTVVLIFAGGLINHPNSSPLGHSLFQQLWIPQAQFWFLYVLFMLHLISLVTLRAGGRWLFLSAFIAVYAASTASRGVDAFVLGYVAGTNILFYVLGVLVGRNMLAWPGLIERPWRLVGICTLLLAVSAWNGWIADAGFYSYVTLPAAVAGVFAVLVLSRYTQLSRSRHLAVFGRLSMAIYVTHILFIAGTRICLVKLLHIEDVRLILPLIFTAGVVGPIAAERLAHKLGMRGVLGLG